MLNDTFSVIFKHCALYIMQFLKVAQRKKDANVKDFKSCINWLRIQPKFSVSCKCIFSQKVSLTTNEVKRVVSSCHFQPISIITEKLRKTHAKKDSNGDSPPHSPMDSPRRLQRSRKTRTASSNQVGVKAPEKKKFSNLSAIQYFSIWPELSPWPCPR